MKIMLDMLQAYPKLEEVSVDWLDKDKEDVEFLEKLILWKRIQKRNDPRK